MSSISLYEAKNNLSALVKNVQNGESTVEITRYDKPVAVLMSYDEFCKQNKSNNGFLSALNKWRQKNVDGIPDADEIFAAGRSKEIPNTEKLADLWN